MKGLSLLMSLLALLSASAATILFFLVGDHAGTLERQLAMARSDAARNQARTNDLTAERQTLAAAIAAFETELDALKARNTTLEARNAQLTREITQIRDQLGLHDRTDQTAADEVAELRRQLLEARTASAVTIGGSSSLQVSALQARVAELERLLAAARQGGDAGAPAADILAAVPADLAGNVIEVGPQAAFVVLDIGSRNGAVASLEMVVRHGATIVARVRLTDVRESYSIAHVVPESGAGSIRTGDIASRS